MVNKRNDNTACSGCFFSRGRGRPKADDATMPREAILKQAFTAFARLGYDGVSMRQLATECGLSNTMLHHHFGTKSELWFEAVDSVFGPIYAQLISAFHPPTPQASSIQTLRAAMHISLGMAGVEREALAFMFRDGEGDNERGLYLRARYVEPYIDQANAVLAEGKARGDIADVNDTVLHAVVLGTMRLLMIPGLLQRELAPHLEDEDKRQKFIDDIVDMMARVLAPPLASASTVERSTTI